MENTSKQLYSQMKNRVVDERYLEDYQEMIRDEIEELRKESLLGRRFENCSFDTTIITTDSFKNAFERCKAYCNAYDEVLNKGYGMYIYGNSGVGKTHLTACMINDLSDKLQKSIITNFFEISKKIRNNWDREEELIKKLITFDFLFIDDFGTEIVKKQGEDNFLQEKVYEIINARYNNLKPTIFTSNHSLNDLVSKKGFLEKTIDRVREMSTRIIKIDGDSFRARGE